MQGGGLAGQLAAPDAWHMASPVVRQLTIAHETSEMVGTIPALLGGRLERQQLIVRLSSQPFQLICVLREEGGAALVSMVPAEGRALPPLCHLCHQAKVS